MKGSLFAAAAIVGSALADGNMHRRHDALHNRRALAGEAGSSAAVPAVAEESCGCSTKVITYYGSPTLVPIPAVSETPAESTTTLTSTVHSTSTATSTVTVTPSVAVTPSAAPSASTPSAPAVESSPSAPAAVSSPPAPTVALPTPGVTSFSETGTYTLSATTLTVTDTTTVCGAATTDVPSGTHTIGEVTTVVSTATTVTCPYATVKTSGTVTTSTIEHTTYVCPSAGTYTVVPGTTTSVPTSTMIVYPTPHTITPGTYTQPETTITATRTDYTYVCPYSGGLSSTSAPVVPTSAPVVPTSAPEAPTSAPVVPATSAEAPASTSSEISKPASTGSFTGDGQYGMTFSPYTTSGDCMSKDEVSKSLKTIKQKGFNLVRVYSTDCSSLEFIGDACKELGISMIVGVFIDSPETTKAKEQVKDICKWAEWDMVKLIVVGNEAISGHGMDVNTLVSFIKEAKGEFEGAGYKGEVTTAEPTNVWQANHGKLCDAVDIVGANIHPFFNTETTAEKAGDFALQEWKMLKGLCGGEKDVLNLETGWPSAGSANGAAIPGKSQQQTAIRGIAKAIGNKSIFFSNADDAWKQPGPHNVEQHWGCSSVF